jgi:hypothetical protein
MAVRHGSDRPRLAMAEVMPGCNRFAAGGEERFDVDLAQKLPPTPLGYVRLPSCKLSTGRDVPTVHLGERFDVASFNTLYFR